VTQAGQLQSVCPILPSTDFDRTVAFYAALGFDTGARYDDQGYLITERDGVELHFFKADTGPAKEHGAYVRVRDAQALSSEFAALDLAWDGNTRLMLAEDKPWGMCELAILDPDGNLIRFGQDSVGWHPPYEQA